MKKYLLLFALLGLFMFSVLAYAANEEIRGAHLENELTCFDCHETDEPTKRANQRLCIDCHGDMSDDTEIRHFKDANGVNHEAPVHTSHAGQLRCTLCHQAHQPSVLYCNEGCHHTFDIQVP